MDAVDQMRADIKAGVPKEIVVLHAHRHLKALKELSLPSEERAGAIQSALSFIEDNTEIAEMNQDDFVQAAIKILEAKGSAFGDGLHYEDDVIAIRSEYNGLDLQVTRVDNNNPTTMVSRGKVIRHHGESCYLVTHLLALVEALETSEPQATSKKR